jgi:hypothetical protein
MDRASSREQYNVFLQRKKIILVTLPCARLSYLRDADYVELNSFYDLT